MKANGLVLLTRDDGEIVQSIPEFGLFYRDTCYLSSYALRLHGTEPLLLMASDGEGMAAAATLDAARGFRNGRLPEFIAGAQRLPGDTPTHTPRADSLQAWSAAAVPFMVSELLGLRADGFANRLHVRRPVLPNGVDTFALHDLRIGTATLSLRFSRQSEGTLTQVTANEAGIDVVIE